MSSYRSVIVAMCLAGCGGAARPATAPTAGAPAPTSSDEPAAGASPDALDNRAEQIDQLWAEIDDWSGQLGIRAAVGSEPAAPPAPECKQVERTAECTDPCTISDSICSNAEKICALADELQESSATQKCTEAKSSCERGKAACCKCSRGE